MMLCDDDYEWKFESLIVYYYTEQPILGIGVHYKYIETYFTIAIQ